MRSAAPRLRVLNWATLIDFHFAGRFGWTGRWPNTILNLGGHGQEGLFNVGRIFRGCFKEWNAQLISIILKMQIAKQKYKKK